MIAWIVPYAAVQRGASHRSDRAGLGARTASSAASSASSFIKFRSRSTRSVLLEWAISIKSMGNGPWRRAPPQPALGAGEGESWDGD